MDFSGQVHLNTRARPNRTTGTLLRFLSCGDEDAFGHLLLRVREESGPSFSDWIECVDDLMDYADPESSWLKSLLAQFTLFVESHACGDESTSRRFDAVFGRLHLLLGDASSALDCFYRSVTSSGACKEDYITGLLGIIEGHIELGNRGKGQELLDFLQITQPAVDSIPRFCLLLARVREDGQSLLDRCRALLQDSPLCVSLTLSLSDELFCLGRYRDSVEILKSLRTKLPWATPAVDILLGVSCINLPQYEEEGLGILRNYADRSSSAAIALSRFYLARDMHAESDSVLSLCSDPALHGTPHFALWKSRFGNNLSDSARISILLAAIAVSRNRQDTKDWLEVGNELVRLYIRSDQMDRGLAVLENKLSHYPEDLLRLLRCRLLFASRKYDECLSLIASCPPPVSPELVDMKKEIYFSLNRFAEYMETIPKDPESVGDGFLRFGKPEDALRWYAQISPSTMTTQEKTCHAYLLSHDFAKALETVESILSEVSNTGIVDSGDCVLTVHFCFKTLIDLERFEKCWYWYEQFPNVNVSTCELVVFMCESIGWIDRGIEVAFACIHKNSVSVGRLALVSLTESLGLLYLKKKRIDEGVFWLSKCVHDTVREDVVKGLVNALEVRGDSDRAATILRQYETKFPKLTKMRKDLWTLSASPSEATLKQLADSPAGPWRLVSLIVENRRLGNLQFPITDEPHAERLWKCIETFDFENISQLPTDCQELAKFVFGLIWMIEGRIPLNSEWLDKNCVTWSSLDPESTRLVRNFFGRNVNTSFHDKLLFRNCIEFLVTELVLIGDPSNARRVVEIDRGCLNGWKILGSNLTKKDDERFHAFEQYIALGGSDHDVLVEVGKWYYKNRMYLELLQLCQRYQIPELKTEYEKSKIKLFRAY